ncbi:phage tail protein I [Tepidibacter thalassicus]|uniref:Phage tail protein, P2 protein I family n=1 Tax=Tepidibacter thalassicus DSM 15285 TaxID=1123350 RepID=A0A1M5NNW6_9FIRM|nr:phage tail protein I [Tepidibacter thalassicus]SHG90623.1 phage tail protein, P2 protein I family [Tepidibacter thalassicus DSM 15285]
MNNTIYDIDLTRKLPPSLKNDENMLALAKVIGEELQKTSKMARKNIIYARIDELEEEALDILAYDLHVDWYDYSYPIEAKRALIKDSVKVHKRLGTKFAVETALGNLHPNSYVEEWFEYNGEPFSFRVVLDTTHSRAGAGYFEIKKAVDSYKRKSAHMDSLIYQCTTGVGINVKAEYTKFQIMHCGMLECGTYPNKNIIGINSNIEVESFINISSWKQTYKLSGTFPQENIKAELRMREIKINNDSKRYRFNYDFSGTERSGILPDENINGSAKNKGVSPKIEAQGYKINYVLCGTKNAYNN